MARGLCLGALASLLGCLALLSTFACGARAGCDNAVSPEFCLVTPATSVADGVICDAVAEGEHVVLRWTIASLADIDGFNIQRALSPEGPFSSINEVPVAPCSLCEYEDATVWPGTEFWYRLSAVTAGGEDRLVAGPVFVRTSGTFSFALGEPYPNPASSCATVTLDLGENCSMVRFGVYDVSGRLVRLISDGPRARGRYVEHWDGGDASGRPVAAGVYLIKADTDAWTGASKVVLVK